MGTCGVHVGRSITSPSLQLCEADTDEDVFSDASARAIGGLRIETGVHWRYELAGEVQRRTVKRIDVFQGI